MKKTSSKGILGLVLVFGFGMVLAGCATRVNLDALRTPTLDTRGVGRIAVRPFTGTGAAQQVATTLTSTAASRIGALGGITLVDYQNVSSRVARGEGTLADHVDAVFTGQVTRVAYDRRTINVPARLNRDGTVASPARTDHELVVEVSFSYSLIRAADGSILGPVTRTGRRSARAESQGGLPSIAALATQAAEPQLNTLYRDLVPHTVTVRRTLVNEQNRALRPQMNAARDLVRAGNHVRARDAYLVIWDEHESIAAAVNAAILYEATGGTQEAAIFMEHVLAVTGSPLARNTLTQLQRELAEQAGVAAFAEIAVSLAERVAGLAVGQILALDRAEGARIWIHNTAPANMAVVNDVIDNMTSTLIADAVPVVERALLDLVMAEQGFQLDGQVADSDLVSIGNLAGANTIVVVGITGAGASRRLQVRVLDIASATVVMQSGTGREWAL